MALYNKRNTGANSKPMKKLLDILFCVLCFYSTQENMPLNVARVSWLAQTIEQKM